MKYFIIFCLASILGLPGIQNGKLLSQAVSHKRLDTFISNKDSMLEKVKIDTLLNFKDPHELIAYYKKKSAIYYKSILKNKTIPHSVQEKVSYTLSINLSKLVFRYLIHCDRNDSFNFNFMLGVIIRNDGLFTEKQLSDLYSSFPEIFKSSSIGKSYLAIMKKRPHNIGKSVLNVRRGSFQNVYGNQIIVDLIDRKHPLTLIYFTASWCGPCKYYINMYKESLEKLYNKDVKIISISIDKSQKDWVKYVQEEKYEWDCYRAMDADNLPIRQYIQVKAIPYCLLIDSFGNIIVENDGYNLIHMIKRANELLSK